MYIYLLAASNFDIIRFEKSCCLKNPIDAMSYTNINRNKFGKPRTALVTMKLDDTPAPCKQESPKNHDLPAKELVPFGQPPSDERGRLAVVWRPEGENTRSLDAPRWAGWATHSENMRSSSQIGMSNAWNHAKRQNERCHQIHSHNLWTYFTYLYIPFRSPEVFHVLEPVVEVCVK